MLGRSAVAWIAPCVSSCVCFGGNEKKDDPDRAAQYGLRCHAKRAAALLMAAALVSGGVYELSIKLREPQTSAEYRWSVLQPLLRYSARERLVSGKRNNNHRLHRRLRQHPS